MSFVDFEPEPNDKGEFPSPRELLHEVTDWIKEHSAHIIHIETLILPYNQADSCLIGPEEKKDEPKKEETRKVQCFRVWYRNETADSDSEEDEEDESTEETEPKKEGSPKKPEPKKSEPKKKEEPKKK